MKTSYPSPFSPLECATFALAGLGGGAFMILCSLWIHGLAGTPDAFPPGVWIALALVLPHVVVTLPEQIRSLRHESDHREGFITFMRSLRPLPETERRHPWTRWAYFFGIGAVMLGFTAFVGAFVIGAVSM